MLPNLNSVKTELKMASSPQTLLTNEFLLATARNPLTFHYQSDTVTINSTGGTTTPSAYGRAASDCNTALVDTPILWYPLNWYREIEVCLIVQYLVVETPLYAVQLSCLARLNTTLQFNSFSRKYSRKLRNIVLHWPECCVERTKQYKILTQSILQMKNSYVPATSRPEVSFSLAGLAQVKFASVSGVMVKIITAPSISRLKSWRPLPVSFTLVLLTAPGALM